MENGEWRMEKQLVSTIDWFLRTHTLSNVSGTRCRDSARVYRGWLYTLREFRVLQPSTR
jgi:hypothetical protein